MNIQSLKKQLINSINNIEDIEYLEGLNQLVKDKDEIYILSKEQESAINEGLKNIEEGKYITDEVLNKEINQWLND
ncbi:MAG: hypothetical protein K1X86_01850 [Ignavibacteria bacterium]|nr:hypothetical protein [Ignavibacteria bacterium]